MLFDTVEIAEPGLSPRVRGNPVFGGCLLCLQRSSVVRGNDGVIQNIVGLSPRVRGNKATLRRGRVYPRVCAGEPGLMLCGGTPGSLALVRMSIGLSPRVRGNLTRWCRPPS